MGGRGSSLNNGLCQLSLIEYQKRIDVNEIKNKCNEICERDMGVINSADEKYKLFKKCPCCGKYTIPYCEEEYQCTVCGWIYNLYQNIHPRSSLGPNSMSLEKAQKLYQEKLDFVNY